MSCQRNRVTTRTKMDIHPVKKSLRRRQAAPSPGRKCPPYRSDANRKQICSHRRDTRTELAGLRQHAMFLFHPAAAEVRANRVRFAGSRDRSLYSFLEAGISAGVV